MKASREKVTSQGADLISRLHVDTSGATGITSPTLSTPLYVAGRPREYFILKVPLSPPLSSPTALVYLPS